MNRKQIRYRRYLRSLGYRKNPTILKIKTKHHMVYFCPPVFAYKKWERFKSLFTFQTYSKPNKSVYRGREVTFSKIQL